ncbi:MAG: AmmeMemoRadiSam system protein B, partial [Candidatus Latescibacteria bacterium]|nr:AmmeMemoRadiSam system protein B [Candidatus Latescibacterota bacterium]
MQKYFRICAGIVLVVGTVYYGLTSNGQESNKMAINQEDIRPSAFAGSWYDADPEQLKKTIDLYLEHAKLSHDAGKIIGLISPHAGYIYSGPVAAYAYKQVKGKTYDTIVVVALDHSSDPRLNFSSVYTRGGYETPLGVVPVDVETAKAIVDFNPSDSVEESELGHLTEYRGRPEHSLEMQIPFLQATVGDFRLVPVVMGDRRESSCTALAEAIASAVKGKNVLLVGSTDLSHFYNAEKADRLDSIIRDRVNDFDPEGLLQDIANGKCEACGSAPMASVMMACRLLGADKSTVLRMANSGDVTGKNEEVVGYLAAVMTMPEDEDNKAQEKEESVGVDLGLTEQEKEVLINVVEQTLESVVNGGNVPGYNNFTGKLGKKWGAFVTLTKNGKLRGCIGHIVGTQPLITTVAHMAKAAALEDSRFPKVQPSELLDIQFEISVLTPVREVKDINEIVVGRDGIIISTDWNNGLLLPQVAAEYGWDRE